MHKHIHLKFRYITTKTWDHQNWSTNSHDPLFGVRTLSLFEHVLASKVKGCHRLLVAWVLFCLMINESAKSG